MFFDESGPERDNRKPRLRLADARPSPESSASERLAAARFRRTAEGPSLLDQLDAIDNRFREVPAETENAKADPVISQSPVVQHSQMQTREQPAAQAMPEAPEPTWEDEAAYAARYQSMPANTGPMIDPAYVFDAIRRFKYLIATTTILGGLLGVGMALNTPKLYSSTAQIIIDPRNNKVVENDISPDVFLSEAALAIVDSQVSIISSPVVMDEVVKQLGLERDAEFNGTKVGLLGGLKTMLSLLGGKAEDSSRMTTAIRTLNEQAGVNRQPGTFIVNVTGKSEDPQKAALIANTIVDVFLKERAAGRASTAGKAADALGSRLPELKKQVLDAEKAVAEFKTQNDLFDAQGRQIDDDSVVRLNEQLNAARISTVNLNSKAASAKTLTADSVASGDLPEELSSTTLGSLRGRYTQTLQKIQGLEAKLGPMHPDLQQAKGEADSLKASIDQEIKRIRSSIQTELKRAVQTEQELAGNLAQMKAKLSNSAGPLVKLRDLERTAASARQVYEQFLLRAQETTEQATIDSTNVTKTNPAKPADQPEGSSRKIIALGGFIGGFAFGLMLAVLKGMWDALATQYAMRSGPMPAGRATTAPPPLRPRPSGRSLRGVVRGSFQPLSGQGHPNVSTAGAVAENRNPPAEAAGPDMRSQMYPYPPIMPSPYAPAQGWQQPVPQPMFGMPMPQPVMQPVMAQAPIWYPQPQFMPQIVPQQYMPQPVVVQNYPAPAYQSQPVQAAEPVQERQQPRNVRPVGEMSDVDEIRGELAEMHAELLNLANSRRRA